MFSKKIVLNEIVLFWEQFDEMLAFENIFTNFVNDANILIYF